MYGLKSHSYDAVIDVIPLEKQFELLELYDTIEDYMLLAQITGIDSLHIKLILHRRRIILNRRGRNPGKYMDAADLILLEWVKCNIRSEKDISKNKIYEQVEHLRALLDIPCYHVRKQTWLQINSVIFDNLKITDSKENFKLNIYSIIKTCGEYILEHNAYRKFMYSVEQNTFFRIKEEVTNTEFDKTDQSVLSKDVENSHYTKAIVDQSVTTPNLISIEKPVVHIDVSNDDDTNKSESKSDLSSKLNDESVKRSSPPDLNLLKKPVIQIDVTNGNGGNKTVCKSDSSFNLSVRKSSLSLEESGARFGRSPDVSLIEKPVIEIDIIDEDGIDNTEIESDPSHKLNDEGMKESSLSLEESEEQVLASPDLILIEKPIVQIDISNDGDENNKDMKNKSNDKLNAECITRSSPSLEERKEEVLTTPDLILIEKPIVQIDISNDDEENNKEMKSNSKKKFTAECIARSSPSLAHMQERVSTSPDLILIEKPIVQIDISNDDDGSNTAIKNDLTFLSPMERNPKILRIKLGKRHHQPVDFEDLIPVPVKKEREEQNKQTTKKDILNISKCNNDCQSNGSALDVLNTPAVDMKANLQPNYRETKTPVKESNGPKNFEVSHPVLIDKEPEGLDNFEEFLDISQHNDDCKLNGSALDIINTSVVDVKQEFENCGQNLQLKRVVTKTKSVKGNVERVKSKIKKAEELNNLEGGLHIAKHNNNRQLNNFNTQVVDIQKDFTRLDQNRTECSEFSTTNYETQRDENLVQEAKPKCPMDCISQTVKKEYDNEIQKENVKLNEVLDRIEKIQQVKRTKTHNNIDNQENGYEDNIEIVFEIEDDDGNVQIELLEISELVGNQLTEK